MAFTLSLKIELIIRKKGDFDKPPGGMGGESEERRVKSEE
jgi:hypothetical protein